MASNIAAYEWQLNGTMHVVYEARDKHMHERGIGQDQTWKDADITRVAGCDRGASLLSAQTRECLASQSNSLGQRLRTAC